MSDTKVRAPGLLTLTGLLITAAAGAQQAPPLLDAQIRKVLTVKTIFVDQLHGADGSRQIRDMLIGSLQRTGLFLLTEDEETADAFLRGSAEDLIFSDTYRDREGLQVRGSTSASRRETGDSKFDSASFGIGETDDSYRRERKHEATAAVRLVLRSGEVVWSTTQESGGGKYRGSGADVAEKVAQELVRAYQRAVRLEKRLERPSSPLEGPARPDPKPEARKQ